MKIRISKTYLDIVIFNELEMEIKNHEINVIIGPSGCGKTTLLHCISNLCEYSGKIENEHIKIGYVFQEDRLFPYLTVLKNLSILDSDLNKINQLLKRFHVLDLKYKYPSELSGGEKQRISLIRAFLGNHDVILMDEPFKSLDYHLKIELMLLIEEIQKETKKTIILVTHDLDIALYLGKYIYVLSKKVSYLKEMIQNPFTYQELNQDSVNLRNKLKKLMK